jgi:hypothetical protein
VFVLVVVASAVFFLVKSLGQQRTEASADAGAFEAVSTAVPPLVVASVQPSASLPASTPPVASSSLGDALTDEQLEGALTAGPLAVGALLQRYPRDGRAHLAQARLAFKLQNWNDSLNGVKTALSLEPTLSTNRHVATILWRVAQLTETKDQALKVLQAPMQSKGADILFDLAVTKGVRKDVADVAAAWLDTRGFERVSTPEASIAAALFRAGNCKVRAALVKRAENVGDRRSVAQLEQFARGKGCHADEKPPCNTCLKDSAEIAQAVVVIAARSKARAAAAASSAAPALPSAGTP